MKVTRRRFAGLMGLAAAGGLYSAANAQSLEDGLSRRHQAGAQDAHAPAATGQGSAAPVAHGSSAKPLSTPNEIWADLVEGNERFATGRPRARDLVASRRELVGGQQPKVIVLGCADSRVSPELVFDKTLGELFVVRTAGNVADPIALGSMEYAVEHLHATVVVVLGHELCGAVSAAISGGTMPTQNLEAIVTKIAPAVDQVRRCAFGDALVSLAVEANVYQSAKDIVASSPILHEEVEHGKVTVIKAVYRMETGRVARLT